MELEPVMVGILIIVTAFCIYRMALAVLVYNDALEHGSDAMSWLALTSVLGIIGVVIWFAARSGRRGYPPAETPPGTPGPGLSPPRQPPGTPDSGPDAPPVLVPRPPPAPSPPPVGPPPPIARPPAASPPWQGVPPEQPERQQIHYETGPAEAPEPRFDPFAVHRMVGVFFAAMAFAAFVELPVILFVMAQYLPPSTDTQALVEWLLSPQMLLYSVAVQDALLVYFLYIAMYKPGHITPERVGAVVDRRLNSAIPIGIAAGLALFGTAILIEFALMRTGWFGEGQAIFQASGGFLGLAMMLVATVLIAPPAEELFFRGYALVVLERKWGPGAGILLSALAFAAVHASLIQFLPIFLVGIALALLFRRWGLLPCIAAHAVNNLLAVLLIYAA